MIYRADAHAELQPLGGFYILTRKCKCVVKSYPYLMQQETAMKPLLTTVALLYATAGAVALADDFTSGLQVGEHAGAYNVKDITGPNKGKSLCYR